MKRLLVALISLTFCFSLFASDSDIVAFYKGVSPASGSKVLTSSFDELKEVKLVLIPIDIDEGKYVLTVSRVASNLYKIDDKNIYIETKFCFEYSMRSDVVLKVESKFGLTKGKIVF